MTLGCIQPSYLPWKGYFHIIQKSDVFVFHDNIQYDKQSWRNRNLIKTDKGKQWISVPVKIKDDWRKNICDVEIDNTHRWRAKHLNLIKQHYIKTPFYQKYIPFFEDVYHTQWVSLSELNIYLTKEIAKMLGIKTRFVNASNLKIEGHKTDRLIQICTQLKAKKYITGGRARSSYIETDKFKDKKIELEYMEYKYPEYPQINGEFDHFVSIIDLLFNCGEESPKYIWG